MARDIIDVHYPVLDSTESVSKAAVTAQSVTVANGIKIRDAFSNRNDSLFIIVTTTTSGGSQVTIKAGEVYPNSMLGDIAISVPQGTSAIQIQDLARFQKADDSIELDFASGFVGTVYAVAKWAGVRPVVST